MWLTYGLKAVPFTTLNFSAACLAVSHQIPHRVSHVGKTAPQEVATHPKEPNGE